MLGRRAEASARRFFVCDFPNTCLRTLFVVFEANINSKVPMSLFPLLFIGAVALSHVYILWTLRRAFGEGNWQYAAFAVLAVGMMSTFLMRYLARLGTGGFLVNIVFLWLGFVLTTTIVLIAGDAVHFAAVLIGKATGGGRTAVFGGPVYYRIVLALAVFFYALYEAYAVGTTHITIPTGKLPTATERFRIVAVSDVHLTRRGDEGRLRRIVELINRQNPDLVVMLGDLVDDWIIDQEQLLRELQAIRAPAGKYAILGNHELYNDMEQSITFTRRAGFTLLRGESAAAGPIVVAGVDDPAHGARAEIAETLRRVESDGRFVLFLAHRPETPEEAAGFFDLQISGHTHGGQLRPGRLLTWLIFGHRQGLNTLSGPGGKQGLLYLTNGAGYWGPPTRLLAPPEIVVVDLVRQG